MIHIKSKILAVQSLHNFVYIATLTLELKSYCIHTYTQTYHSNTFIFFLALHRFYLLASELYCRSGAHADYYRAALRYLGCTEVEEMDSEAKIKQSFYLGLAALLGEGIYNFGELVRHIHLTSL